ncbi:MAG: hypothetical protein IPK82_37215 [Polyangiaceae bacterium]|nr:hypothetical protein [Polyangiaceae bacterium]
MQVPHGLFGSAKHIAKHVNMSQPPPLLMLVVAVVELTVVEVEFVVVVVEVVVLDVVVLLVVVPAPLPPSPPLPPFPPVPDVVDVPLVVGCGLVSPVAQLTAATKSVRLPKKRTLWARCMSVMLQRHHYAKIDRGVQTIVYM